MTTQRPLLSFTRFLAVACLVATSCLPLHSARGQQGAIELVTPFDFSGLPEGTPAFIAIALRDAVMEAERTWETRLLGHSAELPATLQRSAQPVLITVEVGALDGPVEDGGGILAVGGVTETISLTTTRPYVLARAGTITFDNEDVDFIVLDGGVFDVALHELAHAIGFGTLWDPNRLTLGPFGAYTGSYALQKYRVEAGKPDALFVPRQLSIELVPGGHWDPDDAFFQDVTMGRPDLMGPFYDPPAAISETTWSAFADLGFKVKGVNENAGVPAPGTGGTPGTGGRGPRLIPAR